MIKNIMKNIGPKPAGVKAELLNALKNHKKTPGYNYSDFDEKDIDDFLEVAKTDMPNASTDELKNELISRYENSAKLTSKDHGDEEKLNSWWTEKDVVEEMPEGWEKLEGALTAPNGYIVIHNKKSRFNTEPGEKHEQKLLKLEK